MLRMATAIMTADDRHVEAHPKVMAPGRAMYHLPGLTNDIFVSILHPYHLHPVPDPDDVVIGHHHFCPLAIEYEVWV